MQVTGLMEKLDIDPVRMSSALQAIESGYNDNPYHNRSTPRHAPSLHP